MMSKRGAVRLRLRCDWAGGLVQCVRLVGTQLTSKAAITQGGIGSSDFLIFRGDRVAQADTGAPLNVFILLSETSMSHIRLGCYKQLEYQSSPRDAGSQPVLAPAAFKGSNLARLPAGVVRLVQCSGFSMRFSRSSGADCLGGPDLAFRRRPTRFVSSPGARLGLAFCSGRASPPDC
jgi:hypothetical protein